LPRNCRNRGMGNRIRDSRRLEYGQRLRIKENNEHSNLNEKRNLVVLG